MFLYPFSTSFWMFLVLEIARGITNALLSGSLEALVYDTLKQNNQEQVYGKVAANMSSLAWIALFISAVLGGFVFKYWFGTPWILQTLVFTIAAVATLKLVEPKIDSEKYEVNMLLNQNIKGFKELFKNIQITQRSVIFILIGSVYFIASKILGISQAKEYGMNASGVGILFAIGYIISAMFSQLFPRIHTVLGSKKLLILTTVILLSSFLLANYTGLILGSALIIARISTSTTFWNISSVVLNPLIESKNRATTLSTFSLLTQLPYAVLAYGIGNIIEKYSANYFALILGIALIILLTAHYIFFSIKTR